MKAYLMFGFLVLAMLYFGYSSAFADSGLANHVVINEVETDPPGDDSQLIIHWVELFNPTSQPVDVGGWTIGATTGLRNTYTIPSGTSIQSGQFLTYTYGPLWFPHVGAVVQLKDKNGNIIDQTPPLTDQQNDFNSWQRIYDGYSTNSTTDWVFKPATPGSSNGALPTTLNSNTLTVTVSTDKSNYIYGDIVKITGQVSKLISVPNLSYYPEQVNIMISSPSGFHKTVTVYPDTHMQYATDVKVDPTLGYQQGNYNIFVSYGDATSSTQFTLWPPTVAPLTQEAPTIISISTDNPTYVLGETVTLLGNVSKVIPLTPVTYKVYDPNNVVAYQGTLFPDSQGKITTFNPFHTGETSSGILINSVNPVYGTYTIIASYDTATATTSFTLTQVLSQSTPIIVSTDKQVYGLGDTVTITGRTNLAGLAALNVEILQSYTTGVVQNNFDVKSYVNPAPDGTFTFKFLIPGTSDRYGSYRVIVSEKASKAEADFDVVQNTSTFVQTPSGPLTITTDKPTYGIGESIIISGKIASSQVKPGVSLVISVLNGNGSALTSNANPGPNLSGAGEGVVAAPLIFYAYPDSSGNYQLQQFLYRNIFQSGSYVLKATYAKLSTTTSFSVYDPLATTGNQPIIASTDKQVYGVGETVHLTGKLSSLVDTSSYTLTLTKPSGNTISIPLTIHNGFFSWDWTVNYASNAGDYNSIVNNERNSNVGVDSYATTFGIYRITISSDHAKNDSFFYVSKNPLVETKLPSFALETDKTDYTTTQFLQLTGQVIPQVNYATKVQNTMAEIVIYNKKGQEVYRTFAHVSESGQLQTSINLRPGIYKTDEYKVYGTYITATAQTSFKVTDPYTTSSDKLSLLITTDKTKYLPGQTVLITGRTTYIVAVDHVDLSFGLTNETIISEGQVMSKKGYELPHKSVTFDETSSFSYDYVIPQNQPLGNYTITAQVPFGTFGTSFDVVNQLPPELETLPQENPSPNQTHGNVPQATSVPGTIGPTQRIVPSNMMVDKFTRIAESIISIPLQEKTMGNSTLYPVAVDGLLRVNPGDESSINLKLILQDGTCLIGQDLGCKITQSTVSTSSSYQLVQIGNQNFLVGYNGFGARLEKFTILPAFVNGAIPDGQWIVEILKKDQPSRFYYQVTYSSTK